MKGAGERNKRLRIERDTASTQDSEGHVTETWTKVADRWCKVEPLSGRELWDARQIQPDTTHRITMLADTVTKAMTSLDRLAYIGKDRYFHPTEPPRNVNEGEEEIEVMCKEAR